MCALNCLPVGADTQGDVRLLVYSSPNESGGYEPVPPDVPLPDNVTYSLRSSVLGFVTVDTDPNETEYITNNLLNLPWVHEVEHDAKRISGTITFDDQITNNSPDQWAFCRIGVDAAKKPGQNLSPCRVAIIDTGAARHPDVAPYSGGYDFVGQDSRPEDADGHGTALCGIVSMIAGNVSAPESNSSLVIIPERIGVSKDTLSASHSALAIAHATEADADIILMGYGGTEASLAEERALAYAKEKDVLLIAPAGNEDTNTMHYPSDNFEVMSVGSVAKTDGLSYFSNYGIYTELVAPGEEIISAYPDDGYCRGSGTSFAAAEVAGVSALIRNRYPGLTSDEIRTILQSTATDLGRTGRDIYYGYGLLSAPDALKAAEDLSLQKTLKAFSAGNITREMRRNAGQKNFVLHEIALAPGWNFLSIPAPLRSQKTVKDIFSKVNTDCHTIWTYNCPGAGWIPHNPDISPAPMEGLLVYSDKAVSVPLVLDSHLNSSKTAAKGWNLVGSPSFSDTSAQNLFAASNSSWVSILPFNATVQQYDPAIINGAKGRFADSRIISPFTSFWIYLDANGTFTRLSGS